MSDGRAIADYTRQELDTLRARLVQARDTLRAGGRLIQSVARGYYVVYVTASYAAGRHGVQVTHTRRGKRVTDQDFSHSEFVDVLWALYTCGKRGNVTEPGDSPGIASAHYSDRNLYRAANEIFHVRLEADYGPSISEEPYPEAEVDKLLMTAKNLTEDLERLL